MTITTTATVLFCQEKEEDRYLPEGPRDVIVHGRKALAWVNIQTSYEAKSGAIHLRFWDTGEHQVIPLAKRPGFFVLGDEENTLLVGQEKEIGQLDLITHEWTPLATIPDTNPRTIINDGELVPGGKAIVFGTKDTEFREPIAHLYLYSIETKTIHVLADQQTCSNGKVFETVGDEIILFDIDTPRRNVVRYRLSLENKTLTPLGVALDLSTMEGFPDGMANGGSDSLIIAVYNPSIAGTGAAHVFHRKTGELLETISIPGSPRVTCPWVTYARGRKEIVFTTATEGMDPEPRSQSPHAGDLFIV